jgi:fatty-acyl-CoA synthase
VVPFSIAHIVQRYDSSTYLDANKEAVAFNDERITYRELRDRSARLASALVRDGVKHGDRVAILLRNDLAWFDAFFAVAAIGAVFVPVNFLLKPAEIAFQLQDCGAKVLICGADLRENGEHALRESRESPGSPERRRFLVVGDDYAAFRDAAPAEFPDVGEIKPTDIALLQYTSGTTGFPKGATHTVSSVAWMNFTQLSDFGIDTNERYLCMPSLCWAAGLHDFTLAALWAGGSVVLNPSGGLDLHKLFALIEKERITRALFVPTVLKQVVDHPDVGTYDFGSWSSVLSGAEPVPVPVIEKCQRVLPGVMLLQGYGLSEGPAIVSWLRGEDAVRKIGSCGKPVDGCQVRIVDDEDRNVPRGVAGELVVRSPGTMIGYWNRPEANAETLRNGWLHTGDLATMDEEGYLTICGRKKDMYISGGLNVYPAEIEAIILSDAGVFECAVVGVPDDRWGEVGHAVVVARPGMTVDADAMLAAIKAKVATYKVPRSLVLWTEALPRTASGKVRKFAVRDRLTGKA